MSKSDSDSNSFSKTWELNVYELNRIPHEIIFDETEIAVSPKILQNELMCPICLDILKQTMTTKECLHRFCHDCIITALRNGNKECPTCRKKLISKRSLRPDPNFDGIIAKIYPNREEYDAIHEKVLEKLNKKHLTSLNGTSRRKSQNPSTSKNKNTEPEPSENVNAGSSASSTSSDTNQENNNNNNNKNTEKPKSENVRGVKRNAHVNSDESDMESRASTEQSSLHLPNETDETEIILKPHPLKELNLKSKRFLKTTSNATVNHLSKYLWTRLCVEANGGTSEVEANLSEQPTDEFQIFICANEKLPNSYQLLPQNLNLEQILEKYWRFNRPVELFYYQINSKNNPTSSSISNEQSNSSNS
ncbi:unnamed protein product [Brachionus calyciflorus]|uniref:RING-type E3 ubiquitin transferase n=1 Tax=Brachionus calyciflorus TaxID=104777 RepID=A0A813N1U8_9BILA|nr:unnamed protein product [Brachionus calyciflorus]